MKKRDRAQDTPPPERSPWVVKNLTRAAIGAVLLSVPSGQDLTSVKQFIRSDAAVFNGASLRVGTFNVRSFTGDTVHRLASIMQAKSVDVACLQEATQTGVEKLAGLGFNVIFAPTRRFAWEDDAYGNAIVTNYRLAFGGSKELPSSGYDHMSVVESGLLNQSAVLNAIPFPRGLSAPRNLLNGVLKTSNGDISIIDTHLSIHDSERLKQASTVAQYIRSLKTTAILCQDANMTSDSVASSQFGDIIGVKQLKGWPKSYPSDSPSEGIDFISITNDVDGIVSKPVTEVFGSDHRGVIADVYLGSIGGDYLHNQR